MYVYVYICISILKIQGVFLNCTDFYRYIEDRNYTSLNNRHVACDFYFKKMLFAHYFCVSGNICTCKEMQNVFFIG